MRIASVARRDAATGKCFIFLIRVYAFIQPVCSHKNACKARWPLRYHRCFKQVNLVVLCWLSPDLYLFSRDRGSDLVFTHFVFGHNQGFISVMLIRRGILVKLGIRIPILEISYIFFCFKLSSQFFLAVSFYQTWCIFIRSQNLRLNVRFLSKCCVTGSDRLEESGC